MDNGVQLAFVRGDMRVCHTVTILSDTLCEVDPAESFISELMYFDGIMPIIVFPPQATVLINDENETECGEPLIAFPIRLLPKIPHAA